MLDSAIAAFAARHARPGRTLLAGALWQAPDAYAAELSLAHDERGYLETRVLTAPGMNGVASDEISAFGRLEDPDLPQRLDDLLERHALAVSASLRAVGQDPDGIEVAVFGPLDLATA